MAMTASVSSGSTQAPAFGFTIKLRSFDTRPPDPIIIKIQVEKEPEPETEGDTADNEVAVVVPSGPTTE